MIKKLLLPIIAATFMLGGLAFLGGCDTVAGAGQDISAGGHAITRSADEHKN